MKDSRIENKNVIEISQGVDDGLFVPANNELKDSLRRNVGIPVDAFIVLSVGQIIKRKGYDESFEFLSKIDKDFIYLIIGETTYNKGHFMNSYKVETERLIEIGKSLLREKLKLAGAIENTREIYQMADLFLMNSYQEGTPNALLEAMSSGLPILCRVLNGIMDYLVFHEKNGYIFTDYKSFLDGFNTLLLNSGKRRNMGAYSRSIIEREHSFTNIYQNVFMSE